MTAGRSLLKPFGWALKNKKRDRSGSGGSADLKDKKRKSGAGNNSKSRRSARKTPMKDGDEKKGMSSSLEIVAPASSDVEFKYSWPINSFVHQVKSTQSEGLDSKPFEVNVNGIHTTWSLSVRFWVGENGERLSNPFVLCLNLINCKVERNQEVRVKYRFGIYNRTSEEPEMGTPERVTLKQETIDKLQSVGYKNIAMSEKHVNSAGDVLLFVRLSIIREEEANHSLSSDLKSLINDEKSSDLILEAGERKFLVHKNILAARSPVFADLLARLDPADESSPICDCSLADRSLADQSSATNTDQQVKLVPIQESSHSNTSRDIRLLEDLERKLDNIKETDLEAEEADLEPDEDTKEVVETAHKPDIQEDNSAKQEERSVSQESVGKLDKSVDERPVTTSANVIRVVEKKEDVKVITQGIVKPVINSTTTTSATTLNRQQTTVVAAKVEDDAKAIPVKEEVIEISESSTEVIKEHEVGLTPVNLNIEDTSSVSLSVPIAVSTTPRRKDSGLQEHKRKLVIDDLPGDTVEELLKYIYTDSSHNVEAFSQTLLAASDKYKLPGLKQHCEKHLVEIMSPINVSDILLLSDSYGCKDLKRAALAYCGDNHSYIMKDSKWKTIEMENPDLFEEAISLVAPDTCDKHAECLKKGGNRYEAEKTATKGGSLGLAARKKSTVTRKL